MSFMDDVIVLIVIEVVLSTNQYDKLNNPINLMNHPTNKSVNQSNIGYM